MIRDPESVANFLKIHFISSGRSLSAFFPALNGSLLEYMGKRSSITIFVSPSSPDDVNEVISSVSNKSSGINDVPVKIYKLLFGTLSFVISFIFNISIELGVFPQL